MSQALTVGAAVLLGFVAGLVSFKVKTRWCRSCGETLTCATCVRRVTHIHDHKELVRP